MCIRDSLAPILALVFLRVKRFFMLTGLEHWLALPTNRPLRGPLVHLTLRTILLPRLAHTILASITSSTSTILILK